MRIEGNNHLIDYNEVHHVLLESDDQGAMELFGNPTYRGVAFRFNYYHDLGSGAAEKMVAGQAGIRFDDVISGLEVYGNVFIRAGNGGFGGVQINSGRDNVIDNNVICDGRFGVTGGYYPGNAMWQQIRDGHAPAEFYMTPKYMNAYPEMRGMMLLPAVNHVWRTAFINVATQINSDPITYDLIGNTSFKLSSDKLKLLLKTGTFQSSDRSATTPPAFRAIPFDEIGPYPVP